MAKFDFAQRVKVIDAASDYNGQVGTVVVIAPKEDTVYYWLMFGPTSSGGRFGEEQLQAASR